MSNKIEWEQFSNRLYKKGKVIFDHSDVLVTDAGTKDPKVVALTLLARTMGNFESAILLVNNEHLAEARTMVRCCFENLFWIAALVKSGDDFVHAMALDDAASRMKRANGLLCWAKKQNQNYEYMTKLEEFYATTKDKFGRPKPISQFIAATEGGVGDAYIFYRELSGDAAHPSATSLSRHVTWSGDGHNAKFTVHAVAPQEVLAVEDTLELACMALLGVCVAANEILGGTEAGERLEALAVRFRDLSVANKRQRIKI